MRGFVFTLPGSFGVLALVVFSFGRQLVSLRCKFTREGFPPSTVTASARGSRRQHFLSEEPTSVLPSCARLVAAGSRGIRAAVAEGCGATGRRALLLHFTRAQLSATEVGRVLAMRDKLRESI